MRNPDRDDAPRSQVEIDNESRVVRSGVDRLRHLREVLEETPFFPPHTPLRKTSAFSTELNSSGDSRM
jgi:hypothetical protein